MKRLRRFPLSLSTCLVLLTCASATSAIDVIGTAVDVNSKAPLPNCTVTIYELAQTVITDIDGKFEFLGVPEGLYTFMIGGEQHSPIMLPNVRVSLSCCGLYTSGYSGNTNCDVDGKRNLADITRLIDHVYISKMSLCCNENGNTNGDIDLKINLADITKLIDHVYISKAETAACL